MKIAISGKMYSGKTTLAEYLTRVYGMDRVSFALALKERMVEAGISRDAVFKDKPPIVRELLQIYGQAVRAQDENFWVDTALDTIEAGGMEDVVIDDLRFQNEASRLKEDGFYLVRVERTTAGVHAGSHDISELDLDEWDDWDLTITADDGDLMSLFEQIDNFISDRS